LHATARASIIPQIHPPQPHAHGARADVRASSSATAPLAIGLFFPGFLSAEEQHASLVPLLSELDVHPIIFSDCRTSTKVTRLHA
jgi:hypothetical protein